MKVCQFLPAHRLLVVFLVTLVSSHAAAQSLPSGWAATDIGKVIEPGSTQFTNNTFSIIGSGSGVTGASDTLRIVYRSMSGNGSIVARLARGLSRSTDRVGVIVRESVARGSRTVVLDVTGGSRLELRQRVNTDGASSLAASGSATAPTWLRLDRQGSTITASQSADGASWRSVGSVNVALSDTILVGIDASSSWDTAVQTLVSNVTVSSGSTAPAPTTPTTPGNTAPAVSLTTPTSGATYGAPASITVSATASDTDGSVAGVDFYANGARIGTDMASPFSYTWTGVPAGQYSLTAIARDNAGAATTSAARIVTVGAAAPPANAAPSVSLTTPISGATFNAPGTVAVAAAASDSDGTIASVEFYANNARIGTDLTSPYAYTWTGVPAGQYALTAVARDNAGGMTVSSTVMVTVASVSSARTAVFVPSSNHADAVDRYVIDFYPAGANPSTANAVGTIDVGKPAVQNGECRADVGSAVQGLPAGQYFATITALGPGGQARSSPSGTFTR